MSPSFLLARGQSKRNREGFSRFPGRSSARRKVIDLVWGCGAPNTSYGDLQPGLEVASFPLALGPTPRSLEGRGQEAGRGGAGAGHKLRKFNSCELSRRRPLSKRSLLGGPLTRGVFFSFKTERMSVTS